MRPPPPNPLTLVFIRCRIISFINIIFFNYSEVEGKRFIKAAPKENDTSTAFSHCALWPDDPCWKWWRSHRPTGRWNPSNSSSVVSLSCSRRIRGPKLTFDEFDLEGGTECTDNNYVEVCWKWPPWEHYSSILLSLGLLVIGRLQTSVRWRFFFFFCQPVKYVMHAYRAHKAGKRSYPNVKKLFKTQHGRILINPAILAAIGQKKLKTENADV